MITTSKLSRPAQVISGASLLGIAIVAGATGLKINVFHGLEVSPEAGVLFGLADLTKIVLPIVAGIVGWTRQMRLTALVCVTVSLWCAFTAYTGGAGQQIAGKQHGADQYVLAKDAVTKADAEVTRLTAAVDTERKAGGCGKQCKFLQGSLETARQEAKEARTALASAKAVDVNGYERIGAAVTAGMFLFLVEALVWLSVPAMRLLSTSRPAARKRKAQKKRRTTPQVNALKKSVGIAVSPRITKAGQIDRRYKSAKAAKRVIETNVTAL